MSHSWWLTGMRYIFLLRNVKVTFASYLVLKKPWDALRSVLIKSVSDYWYFCVHVSAGGGMLGLSSIKPGSDGQWTVTHVSCHSGSSLPFYLQTVSLILGEKCKMFPLLTACSFCILSSGRSGDRSGLFPFWWKSPFNLLCRFNSELFPILPLFVPAYCLHIFFYCQCLALTIPNIDASYLTWTCSILCYLNLLKTPFSQHIGQSCRCLSSQESAESLKAALHLCAQQLGLPQQSKIICFFVSSAPKNNPRQTQR